MDGDKAVSIKLTNKSSSVDTSSKENSISTSASTSVLSKSKKKRLRKRQKSEREQKESEVENCSNTETTSTPHFLVSPVVQSSQLNQFISFIKDKKDKGKNSTPLIPLPSSNQSILSTDKKKQNSGNHSVINSVSINVAPLSQSQTLKQSKLIKDIKIQNLENCGVADIVSRPAVNVASSIQISSSNQSSPLRNIIENRADCTNNMDNTIRENSDKSREDIKAERQAKKLAKQNAKKKGKIDSDGNKKSSDNSLNVNCSANKDAIVNNESSSGKPQCVDVVDGEMPKISPALLRLDAKLDELSAKTKKLNIEQNSVKEERSREEIMAEREARRSAKKKPQSKGNESSVVEKVESGRVAVDKKESAAINKTVKSEKNTSGVKEVERIPGKVAPAESTAEKSKAELKAERRAKQEAQRAAKEAQKSVPVASTPPAKPQQPHPAKKPVSDKKSTSAVKSPPQAKKDPIKVDGVKSQVQHKLFSHLRGVETLHLDPSYRVHPAIVELGRKYSTRVVSGSDARCVSLLLALKQVIADYKVSSTSDFNRGLEAELNTVGAYLSRSRPLSVSMTNSLRYLKSQLTQAGTAGLEDDEARRKILESVDTFLREQVDVAGQAISNTVQHKINNGDVILTYGCSSLVWRCLKESHLAGKEFSVVVVDGGPWFEGRELLRRLSELSIPCTYLLISAVAFAITKISKVLLGAHALLANGYVMSRTGSALIALTASAHSVPVLVCCETYKFCERVQTDAFVYNELDVSEESGAKGVKMLSPVYDITPPDLVTAVVTELAILPCTSVPVVLRVKPTSDSHHNTLALV